MSDDRKALAGTYVSDETDNREKIAAITSEEACGAAPVRKRGRLSKFFANAKRAACALLAALFIVTGSAGAAHAADVTGKIDYVGNTVYSTVSGHTRTYTHVYTLDGVFTLCIQWNKDSCINGDVMKLYNDNCDNSLMRDALYYSYYSDGTRTFNGPGDNLITDLPLIAATVNNANYQLGGSTYKVSWLSGYIPNFSNYADPPEWFRVRLWDNTSSSSRQDMATYACRTIVYYYPNGGTATSSYPISSSTGASSGTSVFWSDGIVSTTSKDNLAAYNLYDVSELFYRTGYHVPNTQTAWRVGSSTSSTYFNSTSQNVKNYTSTSKQTTVKLYANWVANEYTVSYNKNADDATGTTASTTHTYDVAQNLRANGFTRTGYTFVGWNTRSDGTGTTYKDQQSVINLTSAQNGSIELFAQWKPNNYCYIDGINGSDSNTGLTPETPVKTFKQAYTNVIKNGGTIYVVNTVPVRTNMTLTSTSYADASSRVTLASGSSVIIKRYSQPTAKPTGWSTASNLNTLIRVQSGTLTLAGVTIDGHQSAVSSSNNWETAPGVSAIGPLVDCQSGAKLTITAGTLQNNNNIYNGSQTATSGYYATGGAVMNFGTLTMSGGQISNNKTSTTTSTGGLGAGVWNVGTMTVSGGTISYNEAKSGGGIANGSTSGTGTLTISGGTVSNNKATYGAGVWSSSTSTFNFSAGSISYNSANASNIGGGGGVYNNGTFNMNGGEIFANYGVFAGGVYNNGTMALSAGSIQSNEASAGGGVYNYGTLSMSAGSISDNTSGASGGGVFNATASTLTITAGTLSGNNAGANGGGVFNRGIVNLSGGVIAGNSATYDGDGIYQNDTLNMSANATVNLNNDVYLATSRFVTVTGALTSEDYVALLVPSDYTLGRTVVRAAYGSTVASGVIDSFTMAEKVPYTMRPGDGVDDSAGIKDTDVIISTLYTVAYDANGGTTDITAQIKYWNETITLTSAQPTYTGHTFSNWNTKADGKGTTYASGAAFSVNADTILYAQWNPITYQVRFNSNGGDGGSMSNLTFTYNKAGTLTANAFTRTGHTFTGWNTDAQGADKSYANKYAKPASENWASVQDAVVDLYAQWTPNSYRLDVDARLDGVASETTVGYGTFDVYINGAQVANDVTEFSKTITYGSSYEIKDIKTNTGRVYEGVYSGKATGTIAAQDNIVVLQLRSAKYTIAYYKNATDATGTTASSVHTYGVSKALTANGFARDYYTFAGWNTSAAGTGTTYTNEQIVKNLTATDGATIKLYAQWTPNDYTLDVDGLINGSQYESIGECGTFDVYVNGTRVANDVNDYNAAHPYGSSYEIKDIKTSDGYSYEGVTRGSISGTMPGGGTVVELAFNSFTYTVHYDKNATDATGTTADSTHVYGVYKPLTANGFSREKYVFAGWNTDPEGNGTSYSDQELVKNLTNVNAGTVTLYAQWGINTYTVHYDQNADDATGTTADSEHIIDVAKNLTKNGFERTGYTFGGWTYTPDGSGDSDDIVIELPPAYAAVYKNTDGSEYVLTFGRGTVPDEYEGLSLADYWNSDNGYDIEARSVSDARYIPWYSSYASVITSVDVIDEISPVSTNYWFFGMSNCTTMDLVKLNTSKVYAMAGMFVGCGVSSLDLSSFDTSNVATMYYMFGECESLTSITGLENWDTSKVGVMEEMFSDCYSLTTLDLSSWDTSNVFYIEHMFYRCSSLTEVVLGENFSFTGDGSTSCELPDGSWKHVETGNVYTAAELTASYDGSTMAGTYVIHDPAAYAAVYGGNTLVFGRGDSAPSTYNGLTLTEEWSSTATGTDIEELASSSIPWKNYRNSITTVIVVDEIAPASTSSWFYDMYNCTSMDLELLDTSNVTDMSWMFYNCLRLPSLDVSNFDTSNVTTMALMFSECYSLTTITGLENFDTSSVTDMDEMFAFSDVLTTLDLSSFDTSNVTIMYSLFRCCESLETIYVSELWNTDAVTSSNAMFLDCYALVGGNGTAYDYSNIDRTYARIDRASTPGYLTYKPDAAYAVLVDDVLIIGAGEEPPAEYVEYCRDAWSVTINDVNVADLGEELSSHDPSDVPWWEYVEEITSVIVVDKISPTCTSMWFQHMINCTSMDLDLLDMSYVSEALYMFKLCTSLESLDLSSWDTSNVTNMAQMFYGCDALGSLDVSSWDTSSVTNMYAMFHECMMLYELDLSSFDTSNVTDMDEMFSGCQNLGTIYASDLWSTESLTPDDPLLGDVDGDGIVDESDIYLLQDYCLGYTTLTAAQLEVSDVNDDGTVNELDLGLLINFVLDRTSLLPASTMGQDMFYETYNLVGDVAWNSDYINAMYARTSGGYLTYKPAGDAYAIMDYDAETLYFVRSTKTPVTGETFTASDGTEITCTAVYDGIETSSPAYYFNMPWYSYQPAITSVVIMDEIAPVSTRSWFANMTNCTSIEGLEKLDTSNVTSMMDMFWGCSSLTSLDVSSFDTSNVTDMQGMLSSTSLTTITGLENWNTSNVTDMVSMFEESTSLESLDLSSWDTSNVDYMEYMFYGCESITTLDLSSFDTSAASRTFEMFRGCSSLTKISLGENFHFQGTDTGVFYEEDLLPEGNWYGVTVGGPYTETEVAEIHPTLGVAETYLRGEAYAIYDDTTGSLYFVRSDEEPSSTFTASDGTEITCTAVFSDIEDVDLDATVGVPWWEYYQDILEVKAIDPIAPISMAYWFVGLENCTTMDLTLLDTSNVTTMDSMFYACLRLTSLNLSSWNTSNVTNMASVFSYCTALTTLDLSSWDTSSVTNMSGMFYGCPKLTTIYASELWSNTHFPAGLVYGDVDGDGEVTPNDATAILQYYTSNEISFTDMQMLAADVNADGELNSRDASLVNQYAVGTITSFAAEAYAEGAFEGCTTLVGAISYDSSKTDATYANYETGYLTYKSANAAAGVSVASVATFSLADAVSAVAETGVDTAVAAFSGDEAEEDEPSAEGGSGLSEGNGTSASEGDVVQASYSSSGGASEASAVSLLASAARTLTGPALAWADEVASLLADQAEVTNLTTIPGATVTLFAYWIPNTYTVHYDKNSSDAAGTTADSTHTYDVAKALTANGFSRDGYEFVGWSTEKDSTDTTYANKQRVVNLTAENGGEVTLFAMWEPIGYTVTYDKNNDAAIGTTADSTHTFDVAKSLTANGYTLEGHKFLGWNTKADGTGTMADLEVTEPQAYAIYDETTTTLYFVKTPFAPEKGGTFTASDGTEITCTAVYSGIEELAITSYSGTPWYSYRTAITSVDVIDKISPTSTAYWFRGLTNCTMMELADLDTSNVISMYEMFGSCDSLTSLNLSSWDTTNVTDMSWMFTDCYSLETLDLSSWDTTNVTVMSGMFYDCYSLTTITGLENWDTSNVTNMSYMFIDCDSLTTLDLSSFDTSNVTSMYCMFEYCVALETIYASDLWNTDAVTTSSSMFYQCIKLAGDIAFNSSYVDKTYATTSGGYLTYKAAPAWAQAASLSAEEEAGVTSAVSEGVEAVVVDLIDSATVVLFKDQEVVKNLTTVNGAAVTLYAQWEALDYLLDVNGVLDGSDSSTLGDYGTFDVYINGEQVADDVNDYEVKHGFGSTYEITDIKSNTGRVYEGVYSGKIRGTIAAQDNVVVLEYRSAEYSITYDKNAKEASGTTTDSEHVFDIEKPLTKNGYARTGYTFLGWNTKADGTGTLDDLEVIEPLPGEAYAIYDATSTTLYFVRSESEPSGVFTASDGTEITCTAVYSGIEDKDYYSENDSIGEWESYQSSITNVVAIDRIQPVCTYSWFEGLSNCTTMDLAKLDTSRNTNMRYMFSKCTSLTSIIGLENWDTSNVINMTNMFSDSTSLTSLNLSGWNTSSAYMYSMFRGCTSLTTLDLSSFDTSNVTNMTNMFNSCTSLETIYVSELWNTDAVTTSASMFANCTSLVGDAGTTFDGSHVDAEYARIDGGPDSDTPGYLTYKAATAAASVASLSLDDEGSEEGQVVAVASVLSDDEAVAVASNIEELIDAYAAGIYKLFEDEEIVVNLTDIDGATVKLYAQYAPISYYVNYHPNGATTGMTFPSTHTYDVVSNLTLNGFTKTGWTFLGWNTEPDGSGIAYEDGQEILNLCDEQDEVYDLYAQWEAKSFTIRYDKNNDAATGTTADSDHLFSTPKPLTKNGYTLTGHKFLGWNTKPDGTGTMADLVIEYPQGYSAADNSIVYDDVSIVLLGDEQEVVDLVDVDGAVVTLYAVWEPITYTIHYNPNSSEATGTTASSVHTYGQASSLTPNGYAWLDHTFTGWNTDPEGEDIAYSDQAVIENLTTKDGAEITLYAQWEEIPVEEIVRYTVEFDANGGTGNMGSQQFTKDVTQPLYPNAFTKTGYSFVNWNTLASGSLDSVTLTNLAPTYTENDTKHVKYGDSALKITGDASKPEATQSLGNVELDSSHTYYIRYEHYQETACGTFGIYWPIAEPNFVESQAAGEAKQWNICSAVNTRSSWNSGTYPLRVDFNNSYTAGTVWIDGLVVIDLTEAFGAGNEPNAAWCDVNIPYFEGTTTVKTAYSDQEYVTNLTNMNGGTVVMYAQWEAINYDVVYDANTGEGEMLGHNLFYNEKDQVKANAFTKTGYTFAGWNTEASGKGTSYAPGDEILNWSLTAGDIITLYAQWSPITYQVRFNSNGGDGSMANDTFTYDAEETLRANAFTKTGHTFTGWATSAGGDVVYANKYVKPASENWASVQDAVVDLYAVWTPNDYTLTVNPNGGTWEGSTDTQTFTQAYGTTKTIAEPTRIGYKFNGWVLAGYGSLADGTYTYGAGDATLTAQWTLVTYTNTISHWAFGFENSEGNNWNGTAFRLATDTFTAQYLNTYTLDASNGTAVPNGFTLRQYVSTPWLSDDNSTWKNHAFPVTVTQKAANMSYQYDYYPITYNLTYDAGAGTYSGGNPSTYNVLYGVSFTSAATAPTGYAFAGWYIEDAAKTMTFASSSTNYNYQAAKTGIKPGETYFIEMDSAKLTAGTATQFRTLIYDFTDSKSLASATTTFGDDIAYAITCPSTADASHDIRIIIYAGLNGATAGNAAKYSNVVVSQKVTGINEGCDASFTSEGVDAMYTELAARTTGDKALVAKYSPITYTITYHGNGSTVESSFSVTHTYDAEKAISANASFTKTGYDFVNWNTDPAAAGTTYTPGQMVKNLASTQGAVIDLYAQWTPKAFTISFDGNGATSGSMASETVFYDAQYTVPDSAFAYENHRFVGWNTKADGTGEDWTSLIGTTFVWKHTSNITLYAQWELEARVLVYADGELVYTEQPSTDDYSYTVSAAAIAAATRAGCDGLDGWYTDANYTQKFVNGTVIHGEVAIYARNEATISFDITDTSVIIGRSIFADKAMTTPTSIEELLPATISTYYGNSITIPVVDEACYFDVGLVRCASPTPTAFQYVNATGAISGDVRVAGSTTLYYEWLTGAYDGILSN